MNSLFVQKQFVVAFKHMSNEQLLTIWFYEFWIFTNFSSNQKASYKFKNIKEDIVLL